MAIGAMQGARESGVATPGGLSIVGFDDMAIAAYIESGSYRHLTARL